MPRRVQRVKPAVGQVVSVPVAVVAAPRCVTHHVGNVGDELGFLVEENGQPHASVEGGVGGVEVVVPEFVPGFVSVRGQVEDKGPTLAEALVGTFDEVKGRINGVAGQSRDEKEAVLASCEGLHRFPCQRTVVVGAPIVGTDGAVVGAAQKGEFLVEAGLVVATRHAQWNALGGHQVVQAVHGTSVLQHLEEGRGEVSVELIPIDGFSRWGARLVEQEDTVERDVSSGNERPTDGPALIGQVVDEHADVAVVDDALVREALGNGDGVPRCLIPDIGLLANKEAGKHPIVR